MTDTPEPPPNVAREPVPVDDRLDEPLDERADVDERARRVREIWRRIAAAILASRSG